MRGLWRGVAEKDSYGISIKTVDAWEAYFAATYYAMLTTFSVGYGDNCRPFNAEERLITAFLIVLGANLLAWIQGSFTSSLLSMGQDGAAYDEVLRGMAAYLKYHEVPNDMQERINDYFEYKFGSKTLYVDDAIAGLPARIQADYMLHRFRDVVHSIPFFRGCREDAIVAIVSQMITYTMLPTTVRPQGYMKLLGPIPSPEP